MGIGESKGLGFPAETFEGKVLPETTGNHCLLVFTGESSFQGLLRWCSISSIHAMSGVGCSVV